MSYDTVIEQVKRLPEPLLVSVSAFIKLLEAEHHEMPMSWAVAKQKQKFFDLAGKVHLDRGAVAEFRETSMV